MLVINMRSPHSRQSIRIHYEIIVLFQATIAGHKQLILLDLAREMCAMAPGVTYFGHCTSISRVERAPGRTSCKTGLRRVPLQDDSRCWVRQSCSHCGVRVII